MHCNAKRGQDPASALPEAGPASWAWGKGRRSSTGQQGDEACPRQPASLLGMSKGTVTIISKPQGQSSDNELDTLKSQLSWKSSLPFCGQEPGPEAFVPRTDLALEKAQPLSLSGQA